MKELYHLTWESMWVRLYNTCFIIGLNKFINVLLIDSSIYASYYI